MHLNSLTAISPIDGRYRNKVEIVGKYFSEYALMAYRIKVELLYLIALSKELPVLASLQKYEEALHSIHDSFNIEEALKIKEYENKTHHDVKAVEYFIKDKLESLGLKNYKEYVHFGLTSQDINNTAIPLALKDFLQQIFYPRLEELISYLGKLADEWRNIPMLARTHGQPASPTRLGKEILVYVERLEKQLDQLKLIPHAAKFGGATGNMNAHVVAFPAHDWKKFADHFVNEILGLQRSIYTTQIEHYDFLAAQLDAIKRINTILIDLCRDMWLYISMDYFIQKINSDEVGSSAMPHKVNPIDFENAEGNSGVAIAFLEHLSSKLPISRLQRDLTDSTVLRNLGVPLAHTLLSLSSIMNGLRKLLLNKTKIDEDLEKNWSVVAEAIQTILRREGYPNPYEKLKAFTRGKANLSRKEFEEFIMSLDVSEQIKKELISITPFNYLGLEA
ncbi:MAG: adenylosuccinate lyase [Chitinophagales bacterium]|nr:adenylosuccinate lyase [Chitinophagales bacterium]MDW8273198.1 adenylosuccinate lyase [Chitinophagales bacterium]